MKSKIPLAANVNLAMYGISVGSHGYHCLVTGLAFNSASPATQRICTHSSRG